MTAGTPKLLLASKSPRRHALLTQIGLAFETLDVDIDETMNACEDPAGYVLRMASEKALAASQGGAPHDVILAADTIVVLGDTVFGKPKDRAEALSHLTLLADNTHRVLTAVAIIRPGETAPIAILNENEVTFGPISAAELNRYCDTLEPMDKAGSYAIQGRGAVFVRHLKGSFSGVMGLPLFETRKLLGSVGIEVSDHW